MAGKPYWLRELEEEQTKRLITHGQSAEITDRHREILNQQIPPFWDEAKRAIIEAAEACNLGGVNVVPALRGDNGLQVAVVPSDTNHPHQMIAFELDMQRFRIDAFDANNRTRLNTLHLAVSGGKLALCTDQELRHPSNEGGLADEACEYLLKPILTSYVKEPHYPRQSEYYRSR